MKNLWAPWRMAYIDASNAGATPKGHGCIFCCFPAEQADRDNLILHRGDRAFVMLNRYPYSNAHLMVVPYAHERDLERLDSQVHDDLFRLTTRMTSVVKRAVAAEGMNVGLNLGAPAGAGIAEHLHVHIVPRWNGDTNFMPVVGEVKVISEHLLDTYDRLLACL